MSIINQETRDQIIAELKAGKRIMQVYSEHGGNVSDGAIRGIAKSIGIDPKKTKQQTANVSRNMKRLNADPEFAAKSAAAASENLKRLHVDPQFAARHAAASSERLKRLHTDPRLKAAIKEGKGLRRAYGDYRKRGAPHPGF